MFPIGKNEQRTVETYLYEFYQDAKWKQQLPTLKTMSF